MRRNFSRLAQAAAPNVVALLLWANPASLPGALAVETSPAAETATGNEFALENDAKDHEVERAEIDKILNNIEEQWNNHNLDAVMGYYADDYVNNDGLDKKAVTALTQDFWKTYPDAKSSSKIKQIRIEGNFATIESRDIASGSTAKEMPGVGSKGELKSISEGQLYMKRIGPQWKIVGDRIDFEKVRVAFGVAKNLNAAFSAPEQVKSGNMYSAKLELNLPPSLQAIGSISNQPLEYPQPTPNDAWHQVDGPVLERILHANTNNRNELLMATVGITNQSRSELRGIEFLTRRLNVVPTSEERTQDQIAVDAEKASERFEEKSRREDEKRSLPIKGLTGPVKDETKSGESKPSNSSSSKDEAKSDDKIKTKPDEKTDIKSGDKTELKSDEKSETRSETTKPDDKSGKKSDDKTETKTDDQAPKTDNGPDQSDGDMPKQDQGE